MRSSRMSSRMRSQFAPGCGIPWCTQRSSIFVMEGRLFDPLEKYAVGLLNSLQFRVRLKAQPFSKRLGHDDPPRLIDS
jgi:hypothetical protein